jgi:hypothetical protein
MNRKRSFVLLLLASSILVIIWLVRFEGNQGRQPIPMQLQASNQQITVPPQTQEASQASRRGLGPGAAINPQLPGQQQSNKIREYISLWRTPLLFYGKVIDDAGKPISGVKVSYSANSIDVTLTKDEYNQGIVTTDERGIFQINGIRGIGFILHLEHPDYYAYAANRNGFDIRSHPSDGIIPDSLEHAQVFRMHRKGKPVALIKRNGGLHAPADGTTINFPIRGKSRREIIGEVRAQGWKGAPDPQKENHFDWKVKISVPEGGVLATSKEFAFIAPETGYEQTLEIHMSKDDPNWRSNVKQKLSFKVPNYFIRAGASIDLYHDFYFSMYYYLNPDGSRNLENDPALPLSEP